MSDLPKTPDHRMTRADYYAWVERQPRGRFELIDGRVEAMAPERLVHARTKYQACRALADAIAAAGLPCEAFIDGPALEIGHDTAYEPDVMVACGARLDGNRIAVPDPVIVVEVASPSTARKDSVTKLADYLRQDAIRHYLILDPVKRVLVHHRKAEDGSIATAILPGGPLSLDPPGLALQVEALFPPPD
ncbi:Uma2 family endonuclease [Falsiroseomonas sp. E2-1-a20]|uniref:Uma2 family endonuclease n=1 Tax=Falsiroseomonas sp. E2-1-a20 TaxID=3239300 RepID=UPI003F3DD3D6